MPTSIVVMNGVFFFDKRQTRRRTDGIIGIRDVNGTRRLTPRAQFARHPASALLISPMMCTVLPLYIVEIARSANLFTSRSAFLLASALSASRRNERRVSSRFFRASSAKTQNLDSRRPAVTKSFAKRFRYRSLALTSSKRPAVSSAKTRTGSSQAAASFLRSAASTTSARISGGADARSVAD